MKRWMMAMAMMATTTYAQQLVTQIPLDLRKNQSVFQIVDDNTNSVVLFVADKNTVKAIRLDDKMAMIDSLSAVRPTKPHTAMVGYNITDDGYRLFWSSTNNKQVLAQGYDFETNAVSSKAYDLPLKDETVLQHFTANGHFYIFTTVKKTSLVKLYDFGPNGDMSEKTIDAGHLRFFKLDYTKGNFYDVMGQNLLPFEAAYSLPFINPDNPTSLADSAKKRKSYVRGNEFIVSIDLNIDYTQLMVINLDDFTVSEKYIKKPYISFTDRKDLNSNSFLIHDRLFQLKLSSSKVIVTVNDLEGNVLKQFEATEPEPISFKNSDILQSSSGDISEGRSLEKTARFTRKVNNSNAGLSAYDLGEKYLVTIGSVSEQADNSMMYGAMFGVAGALIAAAISNPTYDSFNSYANRKVVYIDCLIDKQNQHVAGAVPKIAFDKIRELWFNKMGITSETIFKISDIYYLGYFDKNDRKFKIHQFID